MRIPAPSLIHETFPMGRYGKGFPRWVRLVVLATVILGTTSAASSAPAAPPTLQLLAFSSILPEPVDRADVRQAIGVAVDRVAIARFFPGAVPAVGVNHPKLPGYTPQVRGYAYDPAKAKALLAQAGWKGDTEFRIYVPSNRVGRAWDDTKAKVLENLGAVGVKAVFVPVPLANLQELLASRAGTMFLFGWTVGPSEYGYPYFSVSLAHDLNLREGSQALVTRFEQASDAAAKEAIAQELEQLLLDRALVIPLFFQN